MHQDYLSSVIFRSLKKALLFGCQESEEQVDCDAIRKYIHASSSAMEETNYSRRARLHMKPRSFVDADGKKVMAHGERNESEPMWKPNEIRKLENTPSSWSSTALVGDGRSKFIAEDLLRGALELQESIIMLQNLRDSPKFIVPTRRKSKGKYVVESEDANVKFTNSCRFDATGCPRSRHFVNVASGNRGEELRNLIRNNLCRKNLTMVSEDDDEYCCSIRAMSRNNRSIQAYSKQRGQESNIFSEANLKNVKSPNLIAKLMGLEGVPSETIRLVKEESMENKILSFPTARFDSEMPIMRSQPMERRSCLEKKTFQEIKDNLRHKEFLKGSQDEGHITPCYYDTPLPGRNSKNYSMDVEASQIVIMKPMTTTCFERQNLHNGYTFDTVGNEKVIPAAKATLKNMNMVSFKERTEEKIESSPRTEVSKNTNPSISLSNKKKEKKEVGSREIMNVDWIQKSRLDRRRLQERKTCTDVKFPRCQTSIASSFSVKPDRIPTPAKDNPSAPKIGSRQYNKKISRSHPRYSKGSVKEKKKTKTNSATEHTVGITTDGSNCKDHSPRPRRALPRVAHSSKNPHQKQTRQQSVIPTKGKRKKEMYSPCEVMPKPKQNGSQHKSAQEETRHVDTSTPIPASLPNDEGDIRSLLLGNKSFLIHAQELLHPNTNHISICGWKDQEETETRCSGLVIDCCVEILECKARQLNHGSHTSLLSYTWSPRPIGSVDELVEDVIGNIQDLSSYSKIGNGVDQVDGLYLKLERDLLHIAAVGNGGWDFAWKDASPEEETYEIVHDLEQTLTAMLVREAFMELLI